MFNAVLERPSLARCLAVCHPVGHGVARYSAIAQPTLLIFDVDDDGHPVSTCPALSCRTSHPGPA